MKSTFTLNVFVAQALETLSIDLPKLVNAVQASLGSARLVDEQVKRGNVKTVKDDEGTKGADFTFTEGKTNKYRGKTDKPAQFARWQDNLGTFFKKYGYPSAKLDAAIIPDGLKAWLVEKFTLETPETAPDNVPAPETPPANRGNGKARNKGDVKPNVPAATPPAA